MVVGQYFLNHNVLRSDVLSAISHFPYHMFGLGSRMARLQAKAKPYLGQAKPGHGGAQYAQLGFGPA